MKRDAKKENKKIEKKEKIIDCDKKNKLMFLTVLAVLSAVVVITVLWIFFTELSEKVYERPLPGDQASRCQFNNAYGNDCYYKIWKRTKVTSNLLYKVTTENRIYVHKDFNELPEGLDLNEFINKFEGLSVISKIRFVEIKDALEQPTFLKIGAVLGSQIGSSTLTEEQQEDLMEIVSLFPPNACIAGRYVGTEVMFVIPVLGEGTVRIRSLIDCSTGGPLYDTNHRPISCLQVTLSEIETASMAIVFSDTLRRNDPTLAQEYPEEYGTIPIEIIHKSVYRYRNLGRCLKEWRVYTDFS